RTTTVVLLSSFFTCPPAPHHLPSSPTRRSSDLVVAEGPLTAGGSQRPPPAALQPGLQLAGYLGLRLPALLPILGRHRTACQRRLDRKSTRLNSSHVKISYAVFCLKKKKYKSPHG